MGCDIHIFVERKNEKTGVWEKADCNSLNYRDYSLFAFLADVRNYDRCQPLSKPKGIPFNVCEDTRVEWKQGVSYAHSASFFRVNELLDFDYEKTFWNRRISRTTIMDNGKTLTDGASLAEEGEGKIISYKENLGEIFFTDLEELKKLCNPTPLPGITPFSDVRIVFWFDN